MMMNICAIFIVGVTLTAYPSKSVQAQAKTFQLKYAGFMPPSNIMEFLPIWWAKEAEKRTGGRVKVALYHAESLGKLFDQPKMLKGGICDVTQLANVLPEFPILGSFGAPFVIPNRAKNMDGFWTLYYKASSS